MFITNNHDSFHFFTSGDTNILSNIKMSQNIMTRMAVPKEHKNLFNGIEIKDINFFRQLNFYFAREFLILVIQIHPAQ